MSTNRRRADGEVYFGLGVFEGASIEHVAEDMLEVAQRIGIPVRVVHEGVAIVASPFTPKESIVDSWRELKEQQVDAEVGDVLTELAGRKESTR